MSTEVRLVFQNIYNNGWASQVVLGVKNPPANTGDLKRLGFEPLKSGDFKRLRGGGHGIPFQCSCLENLHGQRSLAGYSPWGRRVRHNCSNLACLHACMHNNGLQSVVPRHHLRTC